MNSVTYLNMYIGQTRELQRRLEAWQFPNNNEPIGKKSYRIYQSKNSLNKNDNNTEINPPFETGRSCGNSKFLLFEPPSGHMYTHMYECMYDMYMLTYTNASMCLYLCIYLARSIVLRTFSPLQMPAGFHAL
jgi:hypothetical protein